MPMSLVHSKALYKKYLMNIVCVVSCLMKCQSERNCIAIRSLAVLRVLRTLEGMAGQAILQIMLWFSCPVVYVKSGSNLIHGSTKGEMLVNFLMKVLDACYNEGA